MIKHALIVWFVVIFADEIFEYFKEEKIRRIIGMGLSGQVIADRRKSLWWWRIFLSVVYWILVIVLIVTDLWR